MSAEQDRLEHIENAAKKVSMLWNDSSESLGPQWYALSLLMDKLDAALTPQADKEPDPTSWGGHPYTPNERALGYGTDHDPRFTPQKGNT